MPELFELPPAVLLADLAAGTRSAVDVTTAFLERIDALEPDVHAWAYLDRDHALAQAWTADARRADGEKLGVLHGLPVGVKDIIDTADMPTEYNSPLYAGRRPTRDATLVARLRAAGAIIVGKTVTSEFAVYTAGPTANPHDLAHTPGGSSSGSAAAIAARMVPLALATQTNASTVRPASYCGIVGYKPSLGVLPRTGILQHATMLDQPGLMAMDVAGVALLADVLAGPDPFDEQSFRPPLSSLTAALATGRQPRLAFVRSPFWEQVDADSRGRLDAFVASLGDMVSPLNLPPPFDSAAEAQRCIMGTGIAETCREDYANRRSEMSSILAGIIEGGQAVTATNLVAALRTREALRSAFREISAPYDAIITPASTGVAPLRTQGTGNPIMSTLWNLLGAPAISLPLLTGAGGLPLGVQLVGRLDDDAGLIAAAGWLERHAPAPARS